MSVVILPINFFLRVIYLLLLYLQSLPTVRHWQTSWRIKFKKSAWIKALHQAKTENCSLSVYQHKPSLNIWQKSVFSLATSALMSEVVLFVLSSLSFTGVSVSLWFWQSAYQVFSSTPADFFLHSHGKARHSHLDLLTLFGVCILAILQWFKHAQPIIFIMYCCFEFLKCCIMFLLH